MGGGGGVGVASQNPIKGTCKAKLESRGVRNLQGGGHMDVL